MDLHLDGKKSKEELKYAYCQAGIDIDKEQLEKIIDLITVAVLNMKNLFVRLYQRIIYSKKRT